jgi:hypothetical protein
MLRKQPKTPHVGLFDFAVARKIFAPDSKVWCRPPKLPFTTVDPVAGSCAGFRMPAHRNVSARFGPASESLQGRNPRGRRGGRRLWRFDGEAACASDATVGGGERRQSTAAVGVKAVAISGGRYWCDWRCSTNVQRP